jgi:UDP-N-acetylglucosamine acyltransferase
MSAGTAILHPTAVVHPGAKIGADTKIGPYCIIAEDVELGDGCELMGHVYIEGPLRAGSQNKFFPYAAVGAIPQDLKFHGEHSETIIGARNTIREFVTIHRGTEGGGAVTRIGDDNLLMAYTHVAHDCIIGDHTILANGTTLAGHVLIEDYAVIGAFTGIHQFCRVGRHSMIGAYSKISKDVLPFSTTSSEHECKTYGVNSEGLKRRGFSSERRKKLSHAFHLLCSSKLNTAQAIEQIRQDGGASDDIQQLLSFLESSKRGVIR